MKKIDGIILKQMIISANNNLFNNYPEINQLNVFPVPDGDTGTNMNLTLTSGANMVTQKNEKNIFLVSKAFKEGLLMGARGNSGVILSQIFRGFSDSLKDKEEADCFDIVDAFINAKDVAYKNVMRPTEGTILTVVREAAEGLQEKVVKGMHIDDVFDIYLKEAMDSLQRTPDLLPVLRDAGVVDSGGAGYVRIIEGMAKALHNNIVERMMADVVETSNEFSFGSEANVQAKFKHEEFGYCTEFILRLTKAEDLAKLGKKSFNKKRFDGILNAHGNSIVSVHDEDLVKVHIHTIHPGYVFTYAQQFGEFIKCKIENMSEQHSELLHDAPTNTQELKVASAAPKDKKEFALIAVANGEGIKQIFKDLSVDEIVSGGQTMNPSTEDFVKACRDVNAKDVFIFPNNSNIIMAASQAGDVLEGEVNVHVIPSKSIPAGIAACLVFNPSASVETNMEEMVAELDNVKTGEVTFSVRNTCIDGTEVHDGDFMGISQKKILVSVADKMKALEALIDGMIDSSSDIITIYTGEDVSEEEKEKLEELVSKYEELDKEVQVLEGGQPVYSFYIAVE